MDVGKSLQLDLLIYENPRRKLWKISKGYIARHPAKYVSLEVTREECSNKPHFNGFAPEKSLKLVRYRSFTLF
jgi:hypothetical protein